jgi:autotransporter family porin
MAPFDQSSTDRRAVPALMIRRRVGALAVAIALVGAMVGAVIWSSAPASAASATSNGWTTNGSVTATTVARGATVTVTVSVKSATTRTALVDVEIYDAATKMYQKWWDTQSFAAGQTRTYVTSWTVPSGAALVTHAVRVGVFGAGWSGLQHWNNNAANFNVTAAPTSTTSTTTTRPPTSTTSTTTTRPPTSTTSTTTTRPPATGHFSTLPVGATLPSDADCAARVRPTAEIRSFNAPYNQTKGSAPNAVNPRVTGNFTGTTDEILQWAACKWGIDEDIVRAQIAKESWWKHNTGGDLTTNQSACHPELRTASGPCPESYGLGQVRYAYHQSAMTDAIHSSAYNVDYTYSVWRSCFEGRETWLNQFERGRDYAAGDAWGCVGLWFSGRWYTQAANTYIADVQSYLNQRIWTTPNFMNFAG